jgi:hypothetical protein
MTTTVEPVKKRFRTLDAACEHIEKLELQIVSLNAALTSRTATPARAETPAPPSCPAPPANQPAQAATPAVVKSLNDYSLSELARAADEAGLAGDHTEANRFYRAYSERKANR